MNPSRNKISSTVLYLAVTFSILLLKCSHVAKQDFSSYPAFRSEEILARQQENREGITAFEAEGTARVTGSRGNFVGKMLIFYERPEKLRIETTTPFGHPVSSFLYVNDRIRLHDIKSNTLILAGNRPDHLEQLIQIPLSARELTSLITLGIPADIDDHTLFLCNDKYFFRVRNSRFNMGFLKLNAEGLLDSVLLKGEKNLLEINYSSYRKDATVLFPERISIKTRKHLVHIRLKKINFKKRIPESRFRLSLTGDIETVYLK